MRQTGKTKAMVEALPEGGSIVIVHNGAMADYVRRMIEDLRGGRIALVTKVRTVATYDAAMGALTGVRLPVFLDHAFEEHARPVVKAVVAELMSGIAAGQLPLNEARARVGLPPIASVELARPDVKDRVAELVRAANLRGELRLEPGEPTPVQQLQAEVSRLELRDGDLIVLRPPSQHTDDQVAEMLALIDWVTDDQRQKRIGLMIIDPGAELMVLHHTPAAQEAPVEASPAPVERAA